MIVGRPPWMLDPSQLPPRYEEDSDYPLPILVASNEAHESDLFSEEVLYGVTLHSLPARWALLNNTQSWAAIFIARQFALDGLYRWTTRLVNFYIDHGVDYYPEDEVRIYKTLQEEDTFIDSTLSKAPSKRRSRPISDAMDERKWNLRQWLMQLREPLNDSRRLGLLPQSLYADTLSSGIVGVMLATGILGSTRRVVLPRAVLPGTHSTRVEIFSMQALNSLGFLDAWDTTTTVKDWELAQDAATTLIHTYWQTVKEHPWFYYGKEIET